MTTQRQADVVIVGGGAAGFFAAVNCALAAPRLRVVVLEKSAKFLSKVLVSGGGRCNVTHHCFDVQELVRHYPRGQRELVQAFSRFQPSDTVRWFGQRGVQLKTEADGRMFPVTDNSATIAGCLHSEAQQAGVELITHRTLQRITATASGYVLHLAEGEEWHCRFAMLACGGFPKKEQYHFLRELGIEVVDPVPSLFTFRINDSRLRELAGIAVNPAEVQVQGIKGSWTGPVLITHQGVSGPAVLRASAFAARELAISGYRFGLRINWLPETDTDECGQWLQKLKTAEARKLVSSTHTSELPRRLWEYIVARSGIPPDQRWADCSRKQLNRLQQELTAMELAVEGKNTFKDEFVTAGGISRKEVDFKTMQLKKYPGLYVAGELVDIDAVTGGFNFQAAWTTAWIAAQHMAANTTTQP